MNEKVTDDSESILGELDTIIMTLNTLSAKVQGLCVKDSVLDTNLVANISALGKTLELFLPIYKQMLTNEAVILSSITLLLESNFNEKNMSTALETIASCLRSTQLIQSQIKDIKHE
jgi:hypothetical protein